MKLHQMRYFVEVCRCNSNITKAAKSLCISQPSISSAIKDLEKELGFRLFHRTDKKLYLTKNGEYAYGQISHLLDQTDNVLNDFMNIANNNHRIKLGLPLHVGAFILPLIFGEFHHKYPEVQFELIELGAIDNLQLVENEELDFSISGHGDFSFPDINDIPLFDGECCFCVNKNHPLADKSFIRLKEITNEPLVMLPSGSFVTRIITKKLAELNCVPNVLLYTSQLHSLKSLITSNIASAFILKESILFDQDIVAIPLEEKLVIPITISYKKGHFLSPDALKLIDFLKNKRGKFVL